METQTEDKLRQQAIEQLKKKREFVGHVLAFIAVNSFLVLLWALTSNGGFFWPAIPIGGWGIGLFFHGWDVYFGNVTEEDISKEMARLARHGR